MFDAWVQLGSSDPGSSIYPSSANGIAAWVNKKLGGYPLVGINETLWMEVSREGVVRGAAMPGGQRWETGGR